MICPIEIPVDNDPFVVDDSLTIGVCTENVRDLSCVETHGQLFIKRQVHRN